MTQYAMPKESDGASLSPSGGKSSVYGVTPVVQASAITGVKGTVNLTTTINAVLSIIRNFGLMAS